MEAIKIYPANIANKFHLKANNSIAIAVLILLGSFTNSAEAYEQKIVFNVESTRCSGGWDRECNDDCIGKYSDPKASELITEGWNIVISSPSEALGNKAFGNCSCIGTQYVLSKEIIAEKPNNEDPLLKKELGGVKMENELVIANPSFSITDLTLHKKQMGVDIDKLISALLKAKPPVKSEFESKADFGGRVEKFKERFSENKIIGGDLFAIIQQIETLPQHSVGSRSKAIDLDYDAETETMSADLSEKGICAEDASSNNLSYASNILILKTATTPKQTYKASNSFGKNVNVTVVDEKQTCLIFNEEGNVKSPSQYFKFSIPKKDASATKRQIGIVVIGRIVPPYARKTKWLAPADMNIPIESNMTDLTLTMKVEDVWLVNLATGAIFAKSSTKE